MAEDDTGLLRVASTRLSSSVSQPIKVVVHIDIVVVVVFIVVVVFVIVVVMFLLIPNIYL